MRCSDKNDTAHEGEWFYEKRTLNQVVRFRTEVNLLERYITNGCPELISAIDYGHLGEQSSLAVSHHDHLLQARILSLWIKLGNHVCQGLA